MRWMDNENVVWFALALAALFFWFQLIRAGVNWLFT